ncbi:MAG: phosphodiester glycosidase family protein [Candidatus Dormibacteria bacterium]
MAARRRPSPRWLSELGYCAAVAFLLAVCIVAASGIARALRGGHSSPALLARQLGVLAAVVVTALAVTSGRGQPLFAEEGAAPRNLAPARELAQLRRPVRRWRAPLPALYRWTTRHPFAALAIAVAVMLTPAGWSIGAAVTNPGNGSPPAAAAEWVRSHHGGPLVVWAETQWYSHHQPVVGGKPPPGAIPLPAAVSARPVQRPMDHLSAPASLVPLASPPLPGEGEWHPAGRTVRGSPAVYEAFMRPDPIHTSLVTGIAWMDPTLLSAQLNSGSFIPGSGPWGHSAPVPADAAQDLVAAFNGGFRMQDANGGYYSEGREVVPLVDGAASIVITTGGRMTVAKWGRDAVMGPNVVAVRQNLELLVDQGVPVPGLNASDTRRWGVTLGNHIFVWRSGLGVTANGALVYVGGPGLNITTLADLLVRAGAVRGMELDINTDWVNLSTYNSRPANPADGALLLAGMSGGPGRYFTPSWSRDFLTMSARAPGITRPPRY